MEESSRLYIKEIRVIEPIEARLVRSFRRASQGLIISLGASPLRA
jgi:hypothetical protein